MLNTPDKTIVALPLIAVVSPSTSNSTSTVLSRFSTLSDCICTQIVFKSFNFEISFGNLDDFSDKRVERTQVSAPRRALSRLHHCLVEYRRPERG